jgi:hypothetical protein
MPFCLAKKFCFYGFAWPSLLRIKVRVAGFSREGANGKQIFFCQPNVDL